MVISASTKPMMFLTPSKLLIYSGTSNLVDNLENSINSAKLQGNSKRKIRRRKIDFGINLNK